MEDVDAADGVLHVEARAVVVEVITVVVVAVVVIVVDSAVDAAGSLPEAPLIAVDVEGEEVASVVDVEVEGEDHQTLVRRYTHCQFSGVSSYDLKCVDLL